MALALMFLSLLAIPFFIFARIPVFSVIALIAFFFLAKGMYMLQPNQSALLMLFGSYRGTDYSTGLRWANPFFNKTKVSLRLRNFNSEKLKVNDKRGNPIEIAAAIVWKIDDTAQATFDVDNYEAYVLTQAESAVRHLAMSYAYDNLEEPAGTTTHEVTLRSGTDEVAAALQRELQARFAQAGIVVCARVPGRVERGDCLFHLAAEPSP